MKCNQLFFTKVFLIYIIGFQFCVKAQNMSVYYDFIEKGIGNNEEQSSEKEYRLDILKSKSLFRSEIRRKSDSLLNEGKYGYGHPTNINQELYFSKDLSQQRFSKHFVLSFARDKFFITDFKELQWKISNEILKIGIYNCQKAEVDYGGRHWVAWFSKEIAVPEGPYYFHGLPGLILQIEDDQDNFLFKVTKIAEMTTKDLFERDLGKEISWKQYQKLIHDYYEDPIFSLKSMGQKIYTDDGRGGTKELDNREVVKNIQKNLVKNNNPIELDQKVEFK